jgi:hypothetical protein
MSVHRFEKGPRIRGAKHLDMSDLATTKELFPELNPKGLPQMLPPEVRDSNIFDVSLRE